MTITALPVSRCCCASYFMGNEPFSHHTDRQAETNWAKINFLKDTLLTVK